MIDRRTLVLAAPAVAAATLAPSVEAQMQKKEQLKPELVREFVIAGHGNLEKVQQMLGEQPALLNATWDWGGGDFETALGGAGHTGSTAIVRYLIQRGGRMDIFVAASLGDLTTVKAMLTAFPGLIEAKGPHGISLLTHAKMGGDGALAVFEHLKGLGGK